MKAQLETFLNKHWENETVLSGFLWPFSSVFKIAADRKKKLAVPIHPGVPVIVVGNIYVGGSGKTPITISLVKELTKRGWTPGVISRGYKGKAAGANEVFPDSKPADVGDEAIVIKNSTSVPVFVCRDRVLAAHSLVQKYPTVDVIVSDDGLQHYALARDVELAVIGSKGLGNRRILPAGPLREVPSRLESVDAIVLNGCTQTIEFATPQFKVSSTIGDAVQFSSGEVTPLSALSEKQKQEQLKATAVAGIAAPERFFNMLTAKGLAILPYPLPDHYDFADNPFKSIKSDLIFITEKDAVKCAQHPDIKSDPRIYVVPLRIALDKELVDFIEDKIANLKFSKE